MAFSTHASSLMPHHSCLMPLGTLRSGRRQVRKLRRPLRLLPMRRTFLSLLLFTASLHAATNINVGSTIVTSGARRFGISGISHYYYDRLLLKNLVWRNAGFEGLQWRTVIRCDHGTATNCVDDLLSDQWPNGFWDGGTFEFILGTAKGRTGTIASFLTAPPDNVTGN